MGYASALATMLLVITLIASVPLFRVMKRNENELR